MENFFNSPIPALAMICLLLMADGTGLVRMALLASMFHEAGHCLVYWMQTGKIPTLSVNLYGIALKADGMYQSRIKQSYLLLGGCMTNAVLCVATLLLIEQKATYSRYFFLSANFLTACYNLLPIGVLDGARILKLWLPVGWLWVARIAEQLTLSAVCTLLLFLLLRGTLPLWVVISVLPAVIVPLFHNFCQK